MKNFTQNGVLFKKYRESSDGQAVGVAPILVSGQEGVDSEFGGIINAVDIDWNGADFTTVPVSEISEINTTSDLLRIIKYASQWNLHESCNTVTNVSDLSEINGTYNLIEARINASVSLVGFSEFPKPGLVCDILIYNTGSSDITVSINGEPFIFPDGGSEASITIASGHYAEINCLGGTESRIYTRIIE